MKFRKLLRRTWMGLATITGLGRFGFFIPYRYANSIRPPEKITYPRLEPLFSDAKQAHLDFILYLNEFSEIFENIGQKNPPEPRWLQDWFPRLDGAAAYAMVRRHQPRHIVEVGSGHSTRFMAKAVHDGALTTRIHAIDPAPRADISSLSSVDLHRSTLSEITQALIGNLGAGDILFIDSSHILMPGSDVDDLLNDILPRLPSGVLIHIHDIFLPDGYPPAWSWRGYNEQQGIAALLQGGNYEILFSSHYAVTRLADALSRSIIDRLPRAPGALESSLWLRKRNQVSPETTASSGPTG